MDISNYLQQLLSLHWLRPETALWRVFDCLLATDIPFTGKSIDLGCGDGTLSYIMAGGKIKDYDVYNHIAALDSFNNGSDIYNKVVDVTTVLNIENDTLRHRYTYGVDHKSGLISKANMIRDFYGNTLVHDLNQPLPFADASFDTAFSNILYWLDDLDAVLTEWRRILSPSSKLLVAVPNDNFKEKAWLYYKAPHTGHKEYYNFFDRGYNRLIRHTYSASEWKALFERNGFMVSRHIKYLTDPVMEIWNIGTRPLSPLLISMAAQLPPENRSQIKEEWINYFMKFFYPIVAGEFGATPLEGGYAFHFFVLEVNQ
jgi:SAM-dependent methyltransferase